MIQKLMTVSEFAAAAGVAVVTVRGWIVAGKIDAKKENYKGFRARWFIDADELKKIAPNGAKIDK